MSEHVLIAGATGVVGQAAMRLFCRRADCRVTAVSRRPPPETWSARHQAVDLLDERACADFFGSLRGVTRLVFAALHEKPGLVPGWFEADQIEKNERMLRNLFEPLAAASPDLRHVTLLQGTKAYGAHARVLPVPAREERDEHREVPNFYWRQEGYLREKQAGHSWSLTILRPQIVFGCALGAAMNLIPAIGAYAAISRERGEPLRYPGSAAPVLEAVDADLLAGAIAWAGETPAAANRVFNVTNGDVFTWESVWPAVADALGMAVGEPESRSLAAFLPGGEAEWAAVRERCGLLAPGLAEFVGESHHYADFCMAYGATEPLPAALVSTIRIRQAGFGMFMDTEVMFRKWFRVFQEARWLPPR